MKYLFLFFLFITVAYTATNDEFYKSKFKLLADFEPNIIVLYGNILNEFPDDIDFNNYIRDKITKFSLYDRKEQLDKKIKLLSIKDFSQDESVYDNTNTKMGTPKERLLINECSVHSDLLKNGPCSKLEDFFEGNCIGFKCPYSMDRIGRCTCQGFFDKSQIKFIEYVYSTLANIKLKETLNTIYHEESPAPLKENNVNLHLDFK
jgi:hypothetical protein